MPIFWWYLIKHYFKVLFLLVFSFITILLVSRLREIAQFAAMGAKPLYLALFTLNQIPFFLPHAIPISCAISAMILFQRLSHTHELTALRSGGISLRRIILPILVAAAFVSIGTFYIASEVATSSHLKTRKMIYNLSSVNPILLLQTAKIARLKDAFVQIDPIRNGESAKDLVIAVNNTSGERLTLCLIKRIDLEGEKLLATHVSVISSSPAEGSFDHLIIENQKTMSSSAPEFAKLLRKSGWRVANDHLKLSLLRIRDKMLHSQIAQGNNAVRQLTKCHSEMVRRATISLSAFTFTLMGVSFGMRISRNQKKRDVLAIFALSVSTLSAFYMGMEFDHIFWLSCTLFLVPQICSILISLWMLKRVNRGIE